jgi:hypothetical protein
LHESAPVRTARQVAVVLRYAEAVATALDKDKLHDVLDEAVIVIDEQELERSRRDPRVQELFAQGRALVAELESEGANL